MHQSFRISSAESSPSLRYNRSEFRTELSKFLKSNLNWRIYTDGSGRNFGEFDYLDNYLNNVNQTLWMNQRWVRVVWNWFIPLPQILTLFVKIWINIMEWWSEILISCKINTVTINDSSFLRYEISVLPLLCPLLSGYVSKINHEILGVPMH